MTAFEPYGGWEANASWLALVELTRALPAAIDVTTRLYPVDLDTMKSRLSQDLKANFDVAIHVGQAPHTAAIQLEEVALNIATGGNTVAANHSAIPVVEAGPVAYQCPLPVRSYAKRLRDEGIPTRASFHAGTYLCNATLYWSCHLAAELDLPTRSMFVHIPLATDQVLELDSPTPFMEPSMVARGLLLLMELATSKLRQPLA